MPYHSAQLALKTVLELLVLRYHSVHPFDHWCATLQLSFHDYMYVIMFSVLTSFSSYAVYVYTCTNLHYSLDSALHKQNTNYVRNYQDCILSDFICDISVPVQKC